MLYWGQEVLSDGINIGACVGDFDDNLYLELKSVSELTPMQVEIVKELEDWEGNSKISLMVKHRYFANISFRTMDFLRSKGYAVPYLNWSVDDLIEEGIVKLKKQ